MINYPTLKKVNTQKPATKSHKNRGMRLEKLINEANEYYLAQNVAVIHKKPVPIQIVKVDYPRRSLAQIKEAYYKTPSTTDYNGLYQGKYIDFDVKETKSKTSFPLKNIHHHQISHLQAVEAHGGLAFIIIYVHVHDQAYLIPYNTIKRFIERAKTGRKSMTLEEIVANGFAIKEGFRPRLDYLSALNRWQKSLKSST